MDSLVIFGAKYLFLAVVVLWVMAWLQAKRVQKTQLTWTTAIAVIAAAAIDKLTAALYYDPRPFVTHHIQPLVSHAADNGFPSEHTLFSMALAAALVFFRPKVAWAAMVITLVVGISRVAAHVHSPIDIAGGLLIGALAGYIGYYLMRYLIRAGGRRKDPTK